MGRDDQRLAHAPRGVAQGGDRSGSEVLCCGHYFLWHVDFRGAAALGEDGQCAQPLHGLDDRARALRDAGLELVHDVRDVVLAGAQALPDGQAALGENGFASLLDRHDRNIALRDLDLHRGHHAGSDVAGVR